MSTLFDGRRKQRQDDLPLSAYPGWALEIMMALYGPETIRRACADEAARGVDTTPVGRSAPNVVEAKPEPTRPSTGDVDSDVALAAFNQLDAEREAMDALIRFLGRKLRRR